jgi:hypothetical protein
MIYRALLILTERAKWTASIAIGICVIVGGYGVWLLWCAECWLRDEIERDS